MIDTHYIPTDIAWGIRPVLFSVGNIAVPSYSFFVGLALLVGGLVYFYEAWRTKQMGQNSLSIAAGAIIGGIIGSKILEWLINYDFVLQHLDQFELLLPGRTIVGGLIGGMIGAKIIKKWLKIKGKKGNLFAPAIAIGIVVGRLGCFLVGCCYGQPTGALWGVDFGDGILRHPTQLYESAFMLLVFFFLQWRKHVPKLRPGQLFQETMIIYFSFRFLIEFIRVERIAFWNLSFFQLLSVLVIMYISREYFLQKKGPLIPSPQ